MRRRWVIERSQERGGRRGSRHAHVSSIHIAPLADYEKTIEASDNIEGFAELVGTDLRQLEKRAGKPERVSETIERRWNETPNVVQKLVKDTISYLAARVKEEEDFRLKAEEQSANIIQKLHESNSNLVGEAGLII